MTQRELSTEARLERMERKCHRLTLGVVALAAILATACLSSAMRDVPEVLRAKKIELIRDDGKLGIVLESELLALDGSCGSGILLFGGEDGPRSGWMIGRIRERDEGPLVEHGLFFIEADMAPDDGVSSVRLQATESRAVVEVRGGLERAEVEAEPRSTSLRFRDTDSGPDEDEDVPPRVSLELVDGVPALRALGPDGKTVFEER